MRIALVLVLSSFFGASAAAQPPTEGTATPEATQASVSERARLEFRAGMQAYEEHRYHDAIAAFRRAGELVPSADIWFNVAHAYEELGELDAAIEQYRRYLRDRVDPPDRERVEEHVRQLEERAEAERIRARQTPTTGTLRIDVELAGADVFVDDRQVGTSPLAVPLTYAAGVHVVEVRHEGYVPFRARVRIEAGSQVAAVATLVPATEYQSVRGRRRFTWVMAALAGASLATSIGLGVHAASLQNDGNSGDARRWARGSDIAAGGTFLFGVGTVTLYFAEGRALRTERVE